MKVTLYYLKVEEKWRRSFDKVLIGVLHFETQETNLAVIYSGSLNSSALLYERWYPSVNLYCFSKGLSG